MPHCIVEYSQGLTENVDSKTLNRAVFEGALTSKLFAQTDIKVRCKMYQEYQTGIEKSEFVHVVIKLLQGRTAEQRASLSQLVLHALTELELSCVSLTVEVCEIESQSYAKQVIG